jgi:menaquinone-dependent protoporphyrinogen oxidase
MKACDGSSYGQTLRVAARMAAVLRHDGHSAELVPGSDPPDDLRLVEYDGAIVGASVLLGRHQRYVREFVRRNAEHLNGMPSAFVSVCGAASADPPRAQSYIDRFLLQTGWWRPSLTRSFTGAVAYTKYHPLLRWWLERKGRRSGLPTDTQQDWDFTEWDEVEAFAEFAAKPPVRSRDGRVRVPAY